MSAFIRPLGAVVPQDAMRRRSGGSFARFNGGPYSLCRQQARKPTNAVGGVAHKRSTRAALHTSNPCLSILSAGNTTGASLTVATARRKTEAPNRREVTMSIGTIRTSHRR
jgi:hypothetical protein